MKHNTIRKVIAVLFLLTLGTSINRAVAMESSSKVEDDSSQYHSAAYLETQGLAEKILEGNYKEYVGMIPEQENSIINLYVFGSISRELSDLLKSNTSVAVSINPAAYSLKTLKDGERTVTSYVVEGKIPLGLDLKSTHVNDDGSGLTITLKSNPSKEGEEWLSELESILQIHLDIKVDESEIVPLASRTADVSPWHGGAFYTLIGSNSQSFCSTGFGVVSNTTNLNYLLTARHCFPTGTGLADEFPETTQTGIRIGSWGPESYYSYPDHDIALIRPNGGTVSSYVYDGSYSTSNTTRVTSVASNIVGGAVCANGGNSGRHCLLNITVGPSTMYFGTNAVLDVVTAQRADFTIVGAPGDSGGPVTSAGSVTNTLRGNGIIYALSNPQGTCSAFNTPTNEPVLCYRTLYFTDLASDLADSHMSLK